MVSCRALIEVAVDRCGYLLVFVVCGALSFVVVGCLWLWFVVLFSIPPPLFYVYVFVVSMIVSSWLFLFFFLVCMRVLRVVVWYCVMILCADCMLFAL